MSGYGVQITGLKELQRDLKRADAELPKQLRVAVKGIGQTVADEAKRIAEGNGLVLTGRLVRSIRPSVRGMTAVIRDTAKQRGFNYPVRYEFGDRKRPFLVPAVQRKEGEIVRDLEEVINRVLSGANL